MFWKRATCAGSIALMVVGSIITIFWLVLVKSAEAADLGVVFLITRPQLSLWRCAASPVTK